MLAVFLDAAQVLGVSYMTRDDFHTRLMAARGDQYKQVFNLVREQLRGLDDAQQFDILFPIAIKAQHHAPSCPAAELLWEFRPECPLSCEEAVRALLDEWDVSIEEVPFYLAAFFGLPRVREALKRVGAALEGDRRVQLEAIAYWLKKYEEAQLTPTGH